MAFISDSLTASTGNCGVSRREIPSYETVSYTHLIYNTCILCVLHFVPNGLKLRGHLGSELQRTAATILSIEKDEEPTQSVVRCA